MLMPCSYKGVVSLNPRMGSVPLLPAPNQPKTKESCMLLLTRREGEIIMIGDAIQVQVLRKV
ncbi:MULTISPECIES: carbon storage regulator [Pseudomonas syringae group genomosp. 2]|uniref:carbon storage regulator n=1 Tax=Pseudomonas syringae group genomosp. 2 TaxID=251698 RepID=UPI0027B94070|nr:MULTISPECIES: carbon storage regulator [Pseudomonas syringae group genomosp. 2]